MGHAMTDSTKPLSIGFDVPFSEAIAAAVERGVVLPDAYYGELQGIARQLSFSVAGLASIEQVQQVKNSLDAEMLQGESFNQWKNKVQDLGILDLPKYRLDNIFRTNLQGQYMSGKWEQFDRNKDNRPYLMYDAINDSRVRPAHLALNGIIRHIDDAFWRTHSAPNGYRCRCSMRSLTEKQAQDRSGPGKGLDKQPVLPDGSPAEPDKDWEYSPRDRLSGVAVAAEKNGVDYDEFISSMTKQKWDAGVIEAQNRKINYLARISKRTAAEVEADLQRQIEQKVTSQSLWVTLDKKQLGDVLAEGRILRGSESTVGGLAELQTMLRYDFEKSVLGAKTDSPRYTYGMLSGKQFGMHGMGSGIADVQVKLKHRVLNRTLIANSNEVFMSDPGFGVIPSPAIAPNWRSAALSAKEGGDKIEFDTLTKTWSGFVEGDVSLDDIESVYFPSNKKPSLSLQKALNKAGIKFEIIPENYDPLPPLNDPIEFHAHTGKIT